MSDVIIISDSEEETSHQMVGELKGSLKESDANESGLDAIESKAFMTNFQMSLCKQQTNDEELVKSTNSKLVKYGLMRGYFINSLKIKTVFGERSELLTELLAYAPLPTHVPPTSVKFQQDFKRKQWIEFQERKKLNKTSVPDIKLLCIESKKFIINCTAFSHDVTTLAVGVKDIIMILKVNADEMFNPDSNENLVTKKFKIDEMDGKVLYGHTGTVQKIDFAPFNDYCISTAEDITIRLWSLECYMCLRIFSGHIGSIFKLCFSPQYAYIVSAGYDKTIKIWSVNTTTKPLHVLKYHMADVNDVDIHPNCNYVASASSDALVIVWNVTNAEKVRIFKGHRAAVFQVKFSSCGRFLVSCGRYHKALVWDIKDAVLVAIFNIQSEEIISLHITKDNKRLVAVSDRCVSFWNISKVIKDYREERIVIFSQSNSIEEKYDHWRQWQHSYFLPWWETESTTILSGIVTYGNVVHIACIDDIGSPD